MLLLCLLYAFDFITFSFSFSLFRYYFLPIIFSHFRLLLSLRRMLLSHIIRHYFTSSLWLLYYFHYASPLLLYAIIMPLLFITFIHYHYWLSSPCRLTFIIAAHFAMPHYVIIWYTLFVIILPLFYADTLRAILLFAILRHYSWYFIIFIIVYMMLFDIIFRFRYLLFSLLFSIYYFHYDRFSLFSLFISYCHYRFYAFDITYFFSRHYIISLFFILTFTFHAYYYFHYGSLLRAISPHYCYVIILSHTLSS